MVVHLIRVELVVLITYHVLLRGLVPIHVRVESASRPELPVVFSLGPVVILIYHLLVVVLLFFGYLFILDSFLPSLLLELYGVPLLLFVNFKFVLRGRSRPALVIHRLYERVVSAFVLNFGLLVQPRDVRGLDCELLEVLHVSVKH